MSPERRERGIERRLLDLADAAARRPAVALLALGVLALLGAAGLLRLELRTDGHALVPASDPAVVVDAQVRADFGVRDPIIVYLEREGPGDFFRLESLERLRGLGEAIAALPELRPRDLTSLATEKGPRVYPGTLRFRPLLDPMPDTPERMERLREDVDAIGILDGTLLSADHRGASILVGAPPSASREPGGVDRGALYAELELLRADFEAPDEPIRIVGAPVAEALLGAHVLEDLERLVPLAMLGVAAVIGLSCRRAWGVAIVLVEVALCLLFTFGVMGWCGVPVYLTTAVLPVILTSIGIADELHVLLHYQGELATEGGSDTALGRTMDAMVRPVSLTSLSTGLGFLSFGIAPIAAVAAFGVFAALGIAFCWLWTLVAVPASLSLLGPERLRRAPRRRLGGMPVARLAPALVARPGSVGVVLGLLSLALGAGVLRLQVEDSWIDGFARESPFRRATEYVDGRLAGTHTLLVEVSFEPDGSRWPEVRDGRHGPLLDPRAYAVIARFEEALRGVPGVGGVLGPYSHLSSVNHVFMAGQAGSRSVPREPERVAFVLDRFDQARGARRRREVIHDDLHRGLVRVLVRGASYRTTAVLMERARAAAAEQLAPLGGRIRFAGDLAVSQAMIPAIVRTQLGSLALALVAAFACVAGTLRTARGALLAVAPTGVAVLWLFGLMGWLAVPIGVATSTFSAITLGIGVDYAIHYLERVRRAPDATRSARLERALREAAPAIGADAFAVALGFGVLALSQVPASARLGAIVALGLPAAALLTLAGLPALLSRTSRPLGLD